MLIALCWISWVWKSFFSWLIPEKIENIDKLITIRIRKPRNKKELEDKYSIFMSENELIEASKEWKIALQFDLYSSKYAYLKEQLYSENNYVFEMHYSKIKMCNDLWLKIKYIYIFPNDLQTALDKIKSRNLEKIVEKERISEAIFQYNLIKDNDEILSQFDEIFVNNYDEKSVEKLLEIIWNIV